MDLNITEFATTGDHYNLSCSIATHGDSAGRDSWKRAQDDSTLLINTDEEHEEVLAYLLDFGAWERAEIEDRPTLNALLLQFISGSINELDTDESGEPIWDPEDKEEYTPFFQDEEGSIYIYIGM
jgi:hypothetical protein